MTRNEMENPTVLAVFTRMEAQVSKLFAELDWAEMARISSVFSDSESALNILARWADTGPDFSNISILPREAMNGYDGAYAAIEDRIYLSEAIFQESVTDHRRVDVLLEELGHRIDGLASQIDTPGDEGAMFAAAMRREPVQADSTNDFAVIYPDADNAIVVEAATTVSDSGGFEGSSKVITLPTTNGSTVNYYYEHYGIPDRFTIRYEGRDLFDTGFTGGSRFGSFELPAGQSDQLYILMTTNHSGTAWNYSVTVDASCADATPWIFNAQGGSFEQNSDGDCEHDGDVIIGRSDGTHALLRAQNGNFVYNPFAAEIEGATFVALIGGDQRSLFTGDVELNLSNGSGTIEETADGDFKLAGLDVTFSSIVIQRDMLGFDAQFRLPDEATGLDVDTRNFAHNALRITSDGASSAFDFDITLPDVEFEFMGVVEVEAEDIRLTYLSAEDALKLQMQLELESLLKSESGNDDLLTADLTGDNYLKVNSSGDVELKGVLTFPGSISLPGGWSIGGLEVEIDTPNRSATGTVSIGTPFGVRFGEGVGVQPTVGIIYDPFEFNSFGLALENLNKPIPQYPVVFFQKIGGQIENIAPSATDDLLASLTGGVTLGPQINDESLARADLTFEVDKNALKGEIEAHFFEFELEVFGLDVAEFSLLDLEGDFELNWNAGYLETNASISVLDGLLTTFNTLRFDSDFNFSTSGAAAINIPNSFPVYGGDNIANANYALKFTNDMDLANDYVAVWWQEVVNPFIGSPRVETKGFRLGLDGDADWINNGNIPITSSWFIADGQDFVTLTAYWQNDSTDAALQVVRPNGDVIDEADFAANGFAIVDSQTNARSRTVAIATPEEGTWDLLLVDETGLGHVGYFATGEDAGASMAFTSVSELVGANTFRFDFDVDTTASANISFFVDSDVSALDGYFIGEAIFSSGSHTFEWTDTTLMPDNYFVYAMLDDGVTSPVISISDVAVAAGNEADLSVTLSADVPAAAAGEIVRYTAIIENLSQSGTSSGSVALVNITGPGTFSTSDILAGASDFAQFSFELPDIQSGNSESFTFDVSVDAIAGGVEAITADIYIVSDSYDPDATNDGAFANVRTFGPQSKLPGTVDLSITSTMSDLSEVVVDELLSYSVVVKNTGTTLATNVTLREYVPNLNSHQSSTPFSTDGDALVFALGDLEPGQMTTVEFTGTPAQVGALRATSSADADQSDRVLLDNELLVRTPVVGALAQQADLQLVMDLDTSSQEGTGFLAIKLSNLGPGVASGIEVAVNLPSGLVVESQSSIQGTFAPATGIWTVGNMRDGLERILNLELSGSADADITAEVVSVAELDPNSTPNDGEGNDYASVPIVLNANAAPTDISLSPTTVAENVPGGTLVGALSTTDADVDDTHSYELADDANGLLMLDGDALVVADGAQIDFEATPELQIVVKSTDGMGESVTKPFTIAVTDLEETFVGGADDDIIAGDAGDNFVSGQEGDDVLGGGAGNDDLWGGAGADIFVLSSGHDQIFDFLGAKKAEEPLEVLWLKVPHTRPADKIDLTDLGLTFEGFQENSQQVGDNVVWQIDDDTSLTFVDQLLGNLSERDFIGVDVV